GESRSRRWKCPTRAMHPSWRTRTRSRASGSLLAIATGLFISVEKPGIEKSRQFPAGIITLPQYQWSGQQDLNLRPSGPEPDALPDCATPRRTLGFDTRFNLARQASFNED